MESIKYKIIKSFTLSAGKRFTKVQILLNDSNINIEDVIILDRKELDSIINKKIEDIKISFDTCILLFDDHSNYEFNLPYHGEFDPLNGIKITFN